MIQTYDNAHAARVLLMFIGIISLILGAIILSAGILIFIGVNLFAVILPKYLISDLLSQNTSFIDGLLIASGVSIIIISRLFYTSSKWVKKNERKGGLLAILLSAFSIVLLTFFAVYLKFTLLGDLVYVFILIFIGIILSVMLNWSKFLGGLEEVLSGAGYFIMAGFMIIIIFGVLYIFFPSQLLLTYSTGSSSLYSVLSGNFGVKVYNSINLNYTYPADTVNINLAGLMPSAASAFSVKTSNNKTEGNLSQNIDLNVLVPNSFILSIIGNSPSFISDLKSLNISHYLKQNSSAAREYLESEFPPLGYLYFDLVGYEELNSSYNISIFNISISKLKKYLKIMNITEVNSSFPINITKEIYSNSSYYDELGGYLPSQAFLVNISNHSGIELIYNQYKMFNITKIPFYTTYVSLYQNNKTVCFEVGADLSKSQLSNFNTMFYAVQRTLVCNRLNSLNKGYQEID